MIRQTTVFLLVCGCVVADSVARCSCNCAPEQCGAALCVLLGFSALSWMTTWAAKLWLIASRLRNPKPGFLKSTAFRTCVPSDFGIAFHNKQKCHGTFSNHMCYVAWICPQCNCCCVCASYCCCMCTVVRGCTFCFVLHREQTWNKSIWKWQVHGSEVKMFALLKDFSSIGMTSAVPDRRDVFVKQWYKHPGNTRTHTHTPTYTHICILCHSYSIMHALYRNESQDKLRTSKKGYRIIFLVQWRLDEGGQSNSLKILQPKLVVL